ncbi:MAG: DEAD/DEAH box helicase [Leptospiraceae bacterium]|nr:DEAD/DEAH box helicase [Leptospiraceae bacterium]
MNKSSLLETFIQEKFSRELLSHKKIASSEGSFSPLPYSLNPILQKTLIESGYSQLYSHQLAAFDSISQKKNVVLVTNTASGKTLSFLLPLLNDYSNAKTPFTSILMYPTKALSRDQENTLRKLVESVCEQNKIGTYDGDTPQEERTNILKKADFLITNPDMLHSGILPNHNRKWKGFLSRLRYVVVDEVHSYRGAFGSHVANVFRRLLRLCELHGSKPVLIACSATIGNPKEHVEMLFQREFYLIDKDGSPKAGRNLYFMNPPMVKNSIDTLHRKGANSIAIPILRFATEKGIRTICFCRSRQEVERLYRATIDGHWYIAEKIKPYRGGLLPNERRQLEKDLFSGKINTIIATNALELGIDIGNMVLCVLSGYPGTVSSFWQRVGRTGRSGDKSIAVYIAKDSPIDQYIVNHPEFVTHAPIEQAWLNADNPYILLQHIPCAAYEYPIEVNDKTFSKEVHRIAIDVLNKNKTLSQYNNYYRYALEDFPSKGVNLRGMTDYNIQISCEGEIIGEIDPIGAMDTLYKDAIYQHLGTRYMSLDLDMEKKLCQVSKVSVDYYTESVWESMINMLDCLESKEINGSFVNLGYVQVNRQPKLYKKIKERTYENIGYGPITLKPFLYETMGFCIFPPKTWLEAMEKTDIRFIESGLFGLSYILKKTAPIVCMGDIGDIQTDVSLEDFTKVGWKSSLFLFDSHEGGVGYSEKVYEKLSETLVLCEQIIIECSCGVGCPSCVPPLLPGIENKELESFLVETNVAVESTRSLLIMLIYGKLYTPKVKVLETKLKSAHTTEKDLEREKMEKQLNRAADLLSKKREKIH